MGSNPKQERPLIDQEKYVVVDFPLRGEWVAINTPLKRVPSHGTNYFGQRFAFDFLRINDKGFSYKKSIIHHIFGFVKPEECYGFDENIYAPFEGKVVGVGDGWPDHKKLNLILDLIRVSFFPADAKPDDYRPLTGNYVLLENDLGVALFAHLRCGSLRVEIGQTVKKGDIIGNVGHSGSSTLPHLHFHIMNNRDPFKAEGILCKFTRYERFKNGVWEEVYNSIPGYFERIRLLPEDTGNY